MKSVRYVAISLLIFMTLIPLATAAPFWGPEYVWSDGNIVTTDPLPEGAICTVEVSEIWYWNFVDVWFNSFAADAQYYTTSTTHWLWDNHYQVDGHSFLQLGTVTPEDVDWGPYNWMHDYSLTLIGEGLPLKLKITDWVDGNYTNNVCHMPVTIYCEMCETAWANFGMDGTCLIPNCAKNWGWYSTQSLDDLEIGITSDVWAGAGKCDLTKGENVGTVTVTLDDAAEVVNVDFNLASEDCHVDEWHVWISDNTLCPHKGFNHWYKGEGESGEVELGEALTDPGDDGVYIAVHSVVCCNVENEG